MALDFPSNPADGEVFGSYVWSASKGVWQSREESAAPAVVSPTPPTTPNTGDIWVDSSDGISYVYYDDGTSGQWIEMISSGVVSLASKANLSGGNTFTGTQILGTPLGVSSGGTGAINLTSGGYLKGTGTSAISSQIGIPAEDITSGSLAIARGGTGVATGAGLVPVIPTSVSVGSGTASVAADGTITFSNASNFSVDGVFTTTYRNYRILMTRITANSAAQILARFRSGGSTLTTTTYFTAAAYQLANATSGVYSGFNGISWTELAPATVETGWTSITWDIFQPGISDTHTSSLFASTGYSTAIQNRNGAVMYNVVSAINGFHLYPNIATNISGIVKIYGYN